MKELNKVINAIEDEIGRLEDKKKANLDIISENDVKVSNLNKESEELKNANIKINTDIDLLNKKLGEAKALKKSLEEVPSVFNHEEVEEVVPEVEEEEIIPEVEEEVVPEVEEEEIAPEVVEETPEVTEEVVEPTVEEELPAIEEEVQEEKNEVVEPEYDATLQEMVDQTNTTDKDLFEPNEYTEYTEPVVEPTLLENEKYNTEKAPEVEFTATQEEPVKEENKIDLPVMDEPVVEPKLEVEETANALDMLTQDNPQEGVIAPSLDGFDTTSYQEMYDVKAPINGPYNPREEGVGIDDNRLMM